MLMLAGLPTEDIVEMLELLLLAANTEPELPDSSYETMYQLSRELRRRRGLGEN